MHACMGGYIKYYGTRYIGVDSTHMHSDILVSGEIFIISLIRLRYIITKLAKLATF